ncbi:hypothetical protein FRZ67_02940 [Panacibacter ginsenosidivorans]|uniref:Uncharacterized protein n=1 Tax=Panacibacter ginsenosidivorans TaxID=1813871 RepID=A0A5B8V521_9BACT|nr:hypothetical protein [Panacibacter ginsenosidivorans]QEC66312.1 hypothetical protein FRZ67_02940 [Panacibacter ginsenosidivorans]
MREALSPLYRDHNGIPLINQVNIQHKNYISTFINWCERQEKNKMFWQGLAYMGIIGMTLPLTLASILFLGGANFSLIIIAAVVNVPVLALNLAAQRTKVTLPPFFFALLVDVAIVLYSFAYFLYH